MEDPIRFDLWALVAPNPPSEAATWLMGRRPNLYYLQAKLALARGAISGADPILIAFGVGWTGAKILRSTLPPWLHKSIVVQQSYLPTAPSHYCAIHDIYYGGSLGCHVCRGFYEP